MLVVAGRGDLAYVARVLTQGDSDPDELASRPALAIQTSSSDAARSGGDCSVVGPDMLTQSTSGVVVVSDGSTVCEWYAGGVSEPRAAFSVSKSVLGLVLAREQAAGRGVSADDPVTDHVPELAARDAGFGAVTIEALIDMRSGIAYSQDMSFPWVNRDDAQVHYSRDLVETVLTCTRIASDPGHFQYNDYAPNLVGLAYQRSTGDLLVDGPMRDLWSELGSQQAVGWVVDDEGFPHHEAGLVVHAGDLALLGQELLAALDGGESVFPAALVEELVAAASSEPATSFGEVEVGYADGWWLIPRAVGGVDYAAMGAHGQLVLVSPTDGTVLVRMGEDEPGLTNVDLVQRLQPISAEVAATPGSG